MRRGLVKRTGEGARGRPERLQGASPYVPEVAEFRMQRLRVRVGVAALLCAALGLAYAGGLSGPFVFDDEDGILANPSIRTLWPLSVPLSPPGDGKPVAGRPVANLSLALSWALAGADPFGFRAGNLLLHAASALLGFGILRRCFGAAGMPAALRGAAPGLALSAALLWALHPLASEVVLYAMQRTEALVAFWYLLALYALVRRAEAQSAAAAGCATALAVAACALGMASKEVMVSAPLVLLLYDRAFLSGNLRAALAARGRLHAGLACSWLVLLLLARAAPRGASALFFEPDYLRAQVELQWRYLALALWPAQLALDYGSLDPARIPPFGPSGALLLALLAGVAALAWRAPRAGFPALWWFALLAPSSSFAAVISEVGAERRAYLPLFGACAGAVALAGLALARLPQRLPRRGVALALLLPLLAAATWRTRARSADFADPERLWRSSLEARPENPRAWFNLANQLRAEGRLPEAVEAYQRSLDLAETARAASNLGATLAALGRPAAALAWLERSVALDPRDARARANLGLALTLAGRHDEAALQLARAIELEPREPEHRRIRARALRAAGRLDELRRELEQLLELAPGDPRALRLLRALPTAAPRAPAAPTAQAPPP